MKTSSGSIPQTGPVSSLKLQVLLVLLAFTLLASFLHRHDPGEDLSASYVGCRLLAEGKASHLYSHSATVFSNVGDPLWTAIGREAHFRPVALLHPYVQTPLWAWSLRPLCTRTDFRGFFAVFLVLACLCMSAIIWLAARYWAPKLFAPLPIAIVCALLLFSEPFRYAMYLLQTHVLFVLLTLLALILAQRNRSVTAGVLLALAAAVKITPGFLVIYWLFTRRTKAAVSFIASSVVLLAVTYLTTGPGLFWTFLHQLSNSSHVLLVAFNVQSFAAWITAWHFGAWEQLDWKIHALPSTLTFASLVFSLGSAAVGGWMDHASARSKPGAPPYGAVFALLGVTMFTPIAWNHYYILMVLPVLILVGQDRSAPALLRVVLPCLLVALNLYPVRFGIEHHLLGPIAIIRTQWYSGVLSLIALWLSWRRTLAQPVGAPAQTFAEAYLPG